ncbi:hypothetical protein SESBI_09128 [Sesbania bispinosa]|nr:hypothetical protein SESBI_09128 [Sesbania bispinosa]
MASRSNNGLFQWNSPVPYLFGGIALVFGVVGIAALILIWSRRNKSIPAADSFYDAKDTSVEVATTKIDDEAKILVIVAGENHPTHLAKPSFEAALCSGKLGC